MSSASSSRRDSSRTSLGTAPSSTSGDHSRQTSTSDETPIKRFRIFVYASLGLVSDRRRYTGIFIETGERGEKNGRTFAPVKLRTTGWEIQYSRMPANYENLRNRAFRFEQMGYIDENNIEALKEIGHETPLADIDGDPEVSHVDTYTEWTDEVFKEAFEQDLIAEN